MNTTIDSILRDDIKICQPKDGFRFGCDSVVLAYFSRMKRNWNIADVGSGSGVIAAIIAKMYGAKVTAIEMQESMYNCLSKTIEYSNLQNEVTPIRANIAEYRTEKRFDAIICNPPYRKITTGRVSVSETERIARFSVEMDIEILLRFCKTNLKHGGKLFLSYDADMLVEVIAACRKNAIEPKRIRFVHPSLQSKAKLVFIESVFGAGEELLVEAPLFQQGTSDITATYEKIFKEEW